MEALYRSLQAKSPFFLLISKGAQLLQQYDNSDLERAAAYAREGLGFCRELGDLTGIASILTTLARLTYSRGDFASPGPWLQEVLSIANQLGDQVAEALITYGTLAYGQGDYSLARAIYEEGISLGEKIGYHYQNLWARIFMAHVLLRQGEIRNARRLFEDGIRGMQKADLVIGLVFAVEGLASLHVDQGQMDRAARLFGWAHAMRAKMGDPRPPVEQASVERDLEVIRSKVIESDFVRLWSEEGGLTVDEAVALALEA